VNPQTVNGDSARLGLLQGLGGGFARPLPPEAGGAGGPHWGPEAAAKGGRAGPWSVCFPRACSGAIAAVGGSIT